MKLSFKRRERNAEIRVGAYGTSLAFLIGNVWEVSREDIVVEYAATVRLWDAIEKVWASYVIGERKAVRS